MISNLRVSCSKFVRPTSYVWIIQVNIRRNVALVGFVVRSSYRYVFSCTPVSVRVSRSCASPTKAFLLCFYDFRVDFSGKHVGSEILQVSSTSGTGSGKASAAGGACGHASDATTSNTTSPNDASQMWLADNDSDSSKQSLEFGATA